MMFLLARDMLLELMAFIIAAGAACLCAQFIAAKLLSKDKSVAVDAAIISKLGSYSSLIFISMLQLCAIFFTIFSSNAT